MNKRPNCPICGATIRGAVCEDCGTVILDHCNNEIIATKKLRVNTGDGILVLDADCENVDIIAKRSTVTIWADNNPYIVENSLDVYFDITLRVKPDKKGKLYSLLRKECSKRE